MLNLRHSQGSASFGEPWPPIDCEVSQPISLAYAEVECCLAEAVGKPFDLRAACEAVGNAIRLAQAARMEAMLGKYN